MDEHGPTGSVASALARLSRKRAAEAATGEARLKAQATGAVGRGAGWQGLAAVVVGLTVAAVSAGVLGSQLWHVKRQLERQRRVRALVAEAGLPPQFVPRIETSNRWAIGSSLGVVFGLFWVVWGMIRYRDEQLQGTLLSEGRGDSGAEVEAAPGGPPERTPERADGGRPARRRSGHRCRR